MFQSKRAYWRKLDNAAKLYAATSSKKDPRVFRFYCVLKEEVQPEFLQEALNLTIQKYPIFLSVMRKGLFWHYLERSELRPCVEEEYKEPCSNIYVRDKKSLLFEVTYYKKRINFEVYHVLTDGTGATCFLRELVKNYLVLVHEKDGIENIPLEEEVITVQDQEMDGFQNIIQGFGKRKKEKKAHQIKAMKKERGKLQITEAVLPVEAVLGKARELKVSITVFLTAVFLCAIQKEMTSRQQKRPVTLMIPVNLRSFFPSKSMLNFFGWIEAGYHFQGEYKFEDVLAHVKSLFETELTKENMAMHMNGLIALEVHPLLRLAPLELKDHFIRAGAKIAQSDVTAILSNMGVIRMPGPYIPYIERFGVYTNTPKTELCSCSFGDKLSLGFTSRYDSQNIRRNFFQLLEGFGISAEMIEPDFPEERLASAAVKTFFQRFTFLCICCAVTAVVANLILTPHSFWSLIVCGGILSMWFTLMIGIIKRHNLMKNAMWQLVILTAGCLVWDLGMGWHKWSLNFVFPMVSVVTMLAMLVISRIQKLSPREYMIYFVMSAAYGAVIPLILLLTGALTVTFPSVICMGFSFLFFMAQVIFKRQELGEELNKKFHI